MAALTCAKVLLMVATGSAEDDSQRHGHGAGEIDRATTQSVWSSARDERRAMRQERREKRKAIRQLRTDRRVLCREIDSLYAALEDEKARQSASGGSEEPTQRFKNVALRLRTVRKLIET